MELLRMGVPSTRAFIPSTHSRPDALVPILTARDRGQPYDRDVYARLVREAVTDVVRRQTDAGAVPQPLLLLADQVS